MHGLGLFHTDVKPANILIASGRDGCFVRAVLCDFGCVVEVGKGNLRIEHLLTTRWYRAPEILEGQVEALGTHWLRADLWSLGITFCEVLGFTFFKEPTSASLLDALRNRKTGVASAVKEEAEQYLGMSMTFSLIEFLKVRCRLANLISG